MKNNLVLFVILLLCNTIITVDNCSGFATDIKNDCSSFLSPSKKCYYYDNNCIDWYNTCSEYAPENNFDDKLCESIPGSDKNHKCVAQKNVCTEVYKGCKDLSPSECTSGDFNLNLRSGKRCALVDGNCELNYDICEHDDIKEDQTKCLKNIPSDITKKCKWDATCKTVNKECSDLSEEQCVASDFNIGLDKDKERCVFVKGKCELHYKSCNDLTQTICANNIPVDSTKKCIWDSTCKEDERKCTDFIEYKANSETNSACHSLNHSGSKICFKDIDDRCIETFIKCTDYKEKDKTICESIKPLIRPAGSEDDKDYYVDKLNKCVLDDKDGCIEKKRTCQDYNLRKEDEKSLVCSELQSEKDLDNAKAKCELYEEKCQDMYLSCEYYKDLVTDKDKRNKNDCESILARKEKSGSQVIDDHYKCSFKSDDNNNCKTEEKDCEEITKPETCISHSFEGNSDIYCTFGGTCKKSFKKCEAYSTYYSDDQAKITRNDCESIIPAYDDGKVYKCVYKAESNTKTCEKVEITKCEDYEGKDEGICKSLPTTDDDLYECKLINNKCVQKYKSCEAYNDAQIDNDKLVNKTICESILLDNTISKCVYKNDKYCRTETKLCSEYSGDDEITCNKYRSIDTRKSCVLENKKCVEKLIPQSEEYKYCSDYRGTDEDFCKSIQPYDNNYPPSLDYYSRCEYKNNECVRVTKKCEEAKSEIECGFLKPTDPDKKSCVFTNDKCIEQYKTCALYNAIDGTVEKNVCESIIIDTNYKTRKCVFTAGTGTNKNTCTEEDRSCSDFKIEFYNYKCSDIVLDDKTKKCIFYNNACSIADKTCLELYSLTGPTSEKCGAAKTSSSDKLCVVNDYNTGCKEVDKPKNQDTSNAEQSSGGKNLLNKIILILLCFLF